MKIFSEYNSERLPLFHALDMRLDKRWNFSSGALITYIDIQNVYGNKSVGAYRFDYKTKTVIKQSSIGVLPSVGISYEF